MDGFELATLFDSACISGEIRDEEKPNVCRLAARSIVVDLVSIIVPLLSIVKNECAKQFMISSFTITKVYCT